MAYTMEELVTRWVIAVCDNAMDGNVVSETVYSSRDEFYRDLAGYVVWNTDYEYGYGDEREGLQDFYEIAYCTEKCTTYDVFDVTLSMFPSLGFVGRDLIRRGVEDGEYIVVSGWSRYGWGRMAGPNIEGFVGSALDEDIAQELAERAYRVSNLALGLNEPGSGAHGHDVEIWHIVYDVL